MCDVEMANDEGADPTDDIKKGPGQSTTRGAPDSVDPHKVEKLAKTGEPAVDPNIENPT